MALRGDEGQNVEGFPVCIFKVLGVLAVVGGNTLISPSFNSVIYYVSDLYNPLQICFLLFSVSYYIKAFLLRITFLDSKKFSFVYPPSFR